MLKRAAWAVVTLLLIAGCGGGGGGGGSGAVITPSLPVNISTPTLPNGAVGATYSATVEAVNGVRTSYAWSVALGALPPGLSMGSSGVPGVQILGTPTQAGTFNFSVLVRDGSGFTDLQSYSVQVAAALAVQTSSLPIAVQGTSYAQSLTAAGGSGAGYQWSVVGSSLPPGLSLGASGTPSAPITGTPTAAGTFAFTVRVQDSFGTAAQQAIAVTVNPSLVITTALIPTGTVSIPFAATITATGGSGQTYLWSRAAGSLPAGLTFAPRATPSTQMSGTPTSATTTSFTVEVVDSVGSRASRTFTQTINPAIQIATA